MTDDADQSPPYTLVHGDGPAALVDFGDVDHVFVDVPYSEEVDAGNEAESLRDNPFEFEPMNPELMERMATSIAMRCRRWAIIMTSEEEGHDWRRALKRVGMKIPRTGIWVRQNSKPQMTGDRPAQGHELIICAHSPLGEQRWNGGGKPAVWFAPVVRGEERIHPTQKPVKLLRELIEDFSDPGEIWADFCMGSCVSGKVAVGLGRRFFGCDLDKRYVDHAAEALKLPLFGGRAVQVDMFGSSPASRAGRAREDLDRQILRMITDEGISRGVLDEAIGATRSEITNSLSRLRKVGLIRREGKTKDSLYLRAVQMQGSSSTTPSQSTSTESSTP